MGGFSASGVTPRQPTSSAQAAPSALTLSHPGPYRPPSTPPRRRPRYSLPIPAFADSNPLLLAALLLPPCSGHYGREENYPDPLP